MDIFCGRNGGKAEMLGFSRVLRCWCTDGRIFKFYVREYIEKFNNISIIKLFIEHIFQKKSILW